MSRQVRRHPVVEEDILGIVEYIAKDNLEAALRVWDAIEITFKTILDYPGGGALREFGFPRLAQIRSWPVSGYRNYLILYVVRPYGVYVIAVVHGARDLLRLLRDRYIE